MTFATASPARPAGSGKGCRVIGKLLGHSQVQTTARYAHLAEPPVKAAADRIAGRIVDVAG